MSEVVEQVESIDTEVNIEDVSPSDAGAMSFDELDSITREESVEKAVEKEVSGKKDEPKTENESEAKEIDVAEETIEEEIKKILAKQGEKDLELYANTSFRHKVDGEEVDVELQELLNNYSGKVSYDKKFQELSDTRREFQLTRDNYNEELREINSYINNFAEKLKNNDAMGALEYFAQFAGMKPYEFRRELLNQISPEIQRRSNMSPEQIQAEELAYQNEYLLQKQESVQRELQYQQSVRELENEILNVQEALNIDDATFQDAYYALVESPDFEGEITPDTVAEYYQNYSAYEKCGDILSQVDPVLVNQEPVLDSLHTAIMENPELSDGDLLDIVQTVYNDFFGKASKSVSKKISSENTESSKPKSKTNENYLDFEDLE